MNDTLAIVSTRAGDLGVLVRGRGPDVVLLHGVTDNCLTWLPVMRRLESRARLHAIDLPGHGRSFIPAEPLTMAAMADVIVAYLEAANIESGVIVGNSLGGGVSLGVCAAAPARVRAAVLLGTAGAPFRLDPRVGMLRYRWVTERMTRIARRPWLRWFIIRRGFPLRYRPTDEMVARYWEGWTAPGRADYIARLMRSFQIGEPFPWLPGIRQPVHVMHGTKDQVIPRAAAERIARALPHGRLTMLRGVSHMPEHDATDAVVAAIVEMIAVP